MPKRKIPSEEKSSTAGSLGFKVKKPRTADVTTKDGSPAQSESHIIPELEEQQQNSKPDVPEAKVPHQPTSFFDLPAELRNDIYSQVLIQKHPIPAIPVLPYFKEPALLAVNRQIRAEALPVWYGGHVFEVHGSSPAVKMLRSLPAWKLRSLRTLHIVVTSLPSIDYARDRIKQLNREFMRSGLDRNAIHFPIGEGSLIKWANVNDLEGMDGKIILGEAPHGVAPPFMSFAPEYTRL